MASSKFITHELEGVEIDQRFRDGYLNATKLSKAYLAKAGKRREPNDWLRLVRTKETMEHLSKTTGIPVVSLAVTIEGRHGGTYLHPRLSIRFAIWLDDDFGLAVEDFMAAYGNEFNAFNAARSQGKVTRGVESRALQVAGFSETRHYINTTQVVYRSLFGMDCGKLKEARGVPDDGNLRDHLTRMEVSAIETMEARLGILLETKDFPTFRSFYEHAMSIGQGMKALLLP